MSGGVRHCGNPRTLTCPSFHILSIFLIDDEDIFDLTLSEYSSQRVDAAVLTWVRWLHPPRAPVVCLQLFVMVEGLLIYHVQLPETENPL